MASLGNRPDTTGGREIVSGSLRDFSFEEMLLLLSSSRQRMEVRLMKAGRRRGTLLLKGGQLLDARSAAGAGLDAFRDLLQDPGDAFTAVHAPSTRYRRSIGSISEVLRRSQLPDEGPVVLQGSMANTTFEELVEMLSISRQQLEVVISNDTEGRVGSLVLNSGHILEAHAQDGALTGLAALDRLRTVPGTEFTVFRRALVGNTRPLGTVETLISSSQPLGTMGELLFGIEDADPLVMDGDFSGISAQTLFTVIASSRQRLRLEMIDGDRPLGTIRVQSGMVLTAELSTGVTGAEAFFRLYDSPGTHYQAFQEDAAVPMSSPLGTVSGMLAQADISEDDETSPAPLLEGSFAEHNLQDLLDILSISRQHLEVFFYQGATTIGSIQIKGGQLLSVTPIRKGEDAQAAMHRLLASPGSRFSVYHRASTPRDITSLGALMGLVAPASTPKVRGGLLDNLDQMSRVMAAAVEGMASAQRTAQQHDEARRDTALALLETLQAELREQNTQLEALTARDTARTAELAQLTEQLQSDPGSSDRALFVVVLAIQALTLIAVFMLLAGMA